MRRPPPQADLENSYFAVSWFFHAWVRLIEYRVRKMEAVESEGLGPNRLIISPPTDAGIPLLARANRSGETALLCLSDRLRQVGQQYMVRRGFSVSMAVADPLVGIPFSDQSLSVVYANCLFDFCSASSLEQVLAEIHRVLEPGGILFAVYMAPASDFAGRLWTWLFERLALLSNGCHPVTIRAHLARGGFKVIHERSLQCFGFPLAFIVSERPGRVV